MRYVFLLESIVPTGAEPAVRGHEPLAPHHLPKAVHRDGRRQPTCAKTHVIYHTSICTRGAVIFFTLKRTLIQ